MKNSTRVLALISTQHALMIGRESQLERLTFDLNRLLKDGQKQAANLAYHACVPARTALKLLDVCQGISITLADMLELSLLRVKHYEDDASDQSAKEEKEEEEEEEVFRAELVTVSAAVHIESIVLRVMTRANENLAATKLALMALATSASHGNGAAANGESVLSFEQRASGLQMQLTALKRLTMSYADDLVVQRANIAKYDTPQVSDGYAVKTQKEILQMLAVFAEAQMQKAIALVDIALGCPPRNEIDLAARSQTVAAFGVAAATIAKFIVDMLGDAIAATGTICISRPQLN